MKLFVVAFAAAALFTGTTSAQEARITVSDLNLATPAGAFALDSRIDSSARDLCRGARRPSSRISDRSSCMAAVRAEALRQLPARVLAEYALARRSAVSI